MSVFVKDWRQGLEPFDPETEGKRSNTLVATRVLPTEHLDTVFEPQALTPGNRRWEEDAFMQNWKTLPGYTKDIGGTWVSPPTLPSLLYPDIVPTDKARPMSLVGIAGRKIMDSPDWHSKRANYEGFKYDGFDENKYRLLSQGFPGAQNINLDDLQTAARRIDYGEKGDNPTIQGLVNVLNTAGIAGYPGSDIEFADSHWAPSVASLPAWARTSYPRVVTGEPMEIAMRLLKNEYDLPDWMHHYPTEAMSKPISFLENHDFGLGESMFNHPNWKTFEEEGHPEHRVKELFGEDIAEALRRSKAFSQEWMDREQEQEEMGVWDDFDPKGKPDYAPEVFIEHQRHNIMPDKDCPMCHEMVPAFGNVNVQEPAGAHGVKPGPDMQNYPLIDMEEDKWSPFNRRPHRHGGFSDTDQLKWASEPMEIAMRLLKTSDDRVYREPLFENDGREQHPGRGDENENDFHVYQNETGVGRATMLPWWWIDAKTRETGIQPTNEEIMTHDRSASSFVDTPFNEETGFTRSEPMSIGDVLVKYEDYSLTEGKSNFDDAVNAEYQQNLAVGFAIPPTRWKRTIPMRIDEENMVFSEDKNFEPIEHAITSPTRQAILQAIWDSQELLYPNEENPEGPQGFPSPNYPDEPIMNQYWGEDMDIVNLLEQQMYLSGRAEDELERRGLDFKSPVFAKSDVLVKERVSPEAKRHKLEYDTKYESSPERVKYREDLNRERRHRGMYGDHSHRDISHTEGNKLTVEDEHSNRSRHFKDKGTLRSDTKKAGVAVKQPKPNDRKPVAVKEVGDYLS